MFRQRFRVQLAEMASGLFVPECSRGSYQFGKKVTISYCRNASAHGNQFERIKSNDAGSSRQSRPGITKDVRTMKTPAEYQEATGKAILRFSFRCSRAAAFEQLGHRAPGIGSNKIRRVHADIDKHVTVVVIEPMGAFGMPISIRVISPEWRIESIASNVIFVINPSHECLTFCLLQRTNRCCGQSQNKVARSHKIRPKEARKKSYFECIKLKNLVRASNPETLFGTTRERLSYR